MGEGGTGAAKGEAVGARLSVGLLTVGLWLGCRLMVQWWLGCWRFRLRQARLILLPSTGRSLTTRSASSPPSSLSPHAERRRRRPRPSVSCCCLPRSSGSWRRSVRCWRRSWVCDGARRGLRWSLQTSTARRRCCRRRLAWTRTGAPLWWLRGCHGWFCCLVVACWHACLICLPMLAQATTPAPSDHPLAVLRSRQPATPRPPALWRRPAPVTRAPSLAAASGSFPEVAHAPTMDERWRGRCYSRRRQGGRACGQPGGHQ